MFNIILHGDIMTTDLTLVVMKSFEQEDQNMAPHFIFQHLDSASSHAIILPVSCP